MFNSTLLTGKEIAARLNISKALAYRLIAKGEIPSVRFGRTVRVKQEDLDEFIQNNSSTHSGFESSQVPTIPQKAKPAKAVHN